MLYSVDFRKKVMDHLETSTIHETAQRFKISDSAVSSWRRLLKKTGSLRAVQVIRKPRKINYEELREYVEKHPDKYLREIAEVFKVSLRGIDYALKKMGITLKKRPNCIKRERGRAPKGKKIIGEVSGKRYQRTNIIE